MSLWYRLLYAVGMTPWESDSDTVSAQLEGLLDAEESQRTMPFGPALDLGCGTGRWSALLARRGWAVTGIDIVPKAVHAARQRAAGEGLAVEIIEGDVTSLRAVGVPSGFSFFLDVECFNHLNDAQRSRVGTEVSAVATEDATMLLLAWTRARRGPLPPGVDTGDLTAAFSGWSIVGEYPYEGDLPAPLKGTSPRWFRLRREPVTQT